MSERRARRSPANRGMRATRRTQPKPTTPNRKLPMTDTDPYALARQAVADDADLTDRLEAAITGGLPVLEALDRLPLHRRAERVWNAVTAHEDARKGGPCDACGTVTERHAGTGFTGRATTLDGAEVTLALCSVCNAYVNRYGSPEGYAVVALRAIAGYGTGLPVVGLPPRAKLACETTRAGTGVPWSHVDVQHALDACDKWYGATRRDLAGEPATLIGITPHRWEAVAGPAVPQPTPNGGPVPARCVSCTQPSDPRDSQGRCATHAGLSRRSADERRMVRR